MGWRLARSLERLRTEITAAYPARSTRSDGTRGDPAHAARASRHNPNKAGVVCAIDITHDPAAGCDIHRIARQIVRNPHRDLEYVISNGELAKRRTGFTWEPYRPGPGGNPHDKHAHFAVGQGPDAEPSPPYDDTDTWGIATLDHEEDDMAGEGPEILARVREIQTTQERQNAKLDDLEKKVAALTKKP